jgi:hypothetical protein
MKMAVDMAKDIDKQRVALFAAKDGTQACAAINKLAKFAKAESVEAKQTLADYVGKGAINHMREFACAQLAESAGANDAKLESVFRRGLSDPNTQYWSILGLINTAGKRAYKDLVKLAADKTVPLENRCQAVKCLATFSKQPFDRNLPADPGAWKESDLRLSEIKKWAQDGHSDGVGYSAPLRHDSLNRPNSPLEKIVSQLDKKLAKSREKQDPANPTNWLAIADPKDIRSVKKRWKLPSVYLDFLTRFSPIKLTISNRKYYNHFQLFGASELIQAQDGYSFNPVEQQSIEDWPAHLVVIASHGGDPFVLDLSKSNGMEAPVETAEHGTGEWEFERVAETFSEFLKSLAK